MSYFLDIELDRVKRENYDPGDPIDVFRHLKRLADLNLEFGIVTDNQDPDKYGRVRVHFPHLGENIVTNWINISTPYAGNKEGFYSLPDIGDQVICGFLHNNPSIPIVLGSVYTPRVKPPLESQPDNTIKYFTTKSGSRLILDDTEGAEKIILHSKDASMRMVIDQEKGLSVVNENGDINIKCRKLIMESGDACGMKFNSDAKIECGELSIDSGSKDMALKSGGDAVLTGDPIELNGSTGVTAEMKQIAKENDQVVGVDFHDIQVPSNSGLTTVPMIPHPYLGKLNDNLSEDVKVGGAPAAYKGSKSIFDTPGHICMPPGVKFKSNPNNEGEVSNMTVSSVLINGNEAATLGSMVKTCNDPQPQETCSIIAVGAAVCLPILLPGMDPEEFERAGGTVMNTQEPITEQKSKNSNSDNRSITSTNCPSTGNYNEEITLTANLKNQKEGATVYFNIYKDGETPGVDAPLDKVTGKNKGGTAEAKYYFRRETPGVRFSVDPVLQEQVNKLMGKPISPKVLQHYIKDINDPKAGKPVTTNKYFFEVNSFKCGKETSENIEIGDSISIKAIDHLGKPMANRKIVISNPLGEESTHTLDSNGEYKESGVVGGIYHYHIKKEGN